jgi:hypothetical protein
MALALQLGAPVRPMIQSARWSSTCATGLRAGRRLAIMDGISMSATASTIPTERCRRNFSPAALAIISDETATMKCDSGRNCGGDRAIGLQMRSLDIQRVLIGSDGCNDCLSIMIGPSVGASFDRRKT